MSATDNETMSNPGPTKAVPEHGWLKHLIGNWKTESEMIMGPDQTPMTGSGSETVTAFGDLWVFTEGTGKWEMGEMHYKVALGYDVSFKEYRGAWFCTDSSHLWKYIGELSADGKTMTLNCEGPDMVTDGKTANYRDVIELIDENTRVMKSYGQGEDGTWTQFMTVTYRRA